MSEFSILSNRKRTLIALIHSVVFFAIALHGFTAPKAGLIHPPDATADFLLLAIYLVVASILAWLVAISRGVRERLYFALCTCSATFGLLRTTFGDQTLPAAQYLRVAMLGSAIVICSWILRSFSRPATDNAYSD